MKRKGIVVLLACFLLMLSLLPVGCGGGGGGTGSSNVTPTPALEISDGTYDFGNVTVGNTATLPFTISNRGTGNLSVASVTLSDKVNFFIDPGACGAPPYTLAPGVECTLYVGFAPMAAAPYSATLSIITNDANNPDSTANFTGTGTMIAELTVSLNQIETNCSTTPPTVTAYVSVTDQEDYAVAGLQTADFRITENAAAVPIIPDTVDFAENAALSISTAILMDYSGSILSVPGLTDDIEDAIVNFVTAMAPSDQGEIIKFGTKVKVMQPFTADKQLLTAAILAPPPADLGRDTALYDAIWEGIEDAALTTTHRWAVIVLTDGFDQALPLNTPGSGSIHTINEVIALGQVKGVPVFTIGMGSKVNPVPLRQIASQTGGLYFDALDANGLRTIYAQLSDLLKSQYVLTYTPPVRAAGATVSVTVAVPDGVPDPGVLGDESDPLNYTTCP